MPVIGSGLLIGEGEGGASGAINLIYNSAGDSNGLFYYLGTNLGSASWSNPAGNSLIISTSTTEFGNANTLSGRSPSEWFSTISTYNWVSFHILNHQLTCNHYTIQTRSNEIDYYPRNWILQGSNDGYTWDDLDIQVNNTALNSISQWLSLPVVPTISYSYFRILHNGLDSSGVGYLCLGQVELYGRFFR